MLTVLLFTFYHGQPLDYDSKPRMEQIYIRVRVADPQYQDDAYITFYITDANDNAPVFEPRQIGATLSEDVQIGTSVATFTATDIDSGANAEFTYVHSDTPYTAKCISDEMYQFMSYFYLPAGIENSAGGIGLTSVPRRRRAPLKALCLSWY